MDEEGKKAYIDAIAEKEKLAKKAKLETAKVVEDYDFKVKYQSLRTFKDVPDEIKEVTITKALNDTIEIKWNKPESNNSAITGYNIYLSDLVVFNISTTNLQTTGQKHNYQLIGSTDK